MKILKWGAIILAVILLLSLFVPFGEVVFSFVFHLLLGGFAHLWASLPHMVPSLPGTVGFIVLLTASVGALQALLRKFARAQSGSEFRWKPRWTLSLVGLVLAAFGTACTTVGLAHHATWLVREDVIYFAGSRNPGTQSISNCRQLVMGLKLYAADHQGAYPRTLEELADEGIFSHEELERINKAIHQDGLLLPLIFLPGLHDADPGDLPLVVSPVPISRHGYVVGMNDGRALLIKPQLYEAVMASYRQHVQRAPAK